MADPGSQPVDPLAISKADDDLKVEASAYSSASSGSKVVYDGAGDVIPLYEGKEFLLYFDFLFRFWVYWDTIPHCVAYFSAFGFFLGGQLFIIGTFSALSPAVQATAVPLSCGTDAFSWWTAFPYLVGDVVWQIACTLQIIESLNIDYEDQVEAWEVSGRIGPKPKYRWFGIRLKQLDWWGAVCYDLGVAMYLTAEIVIYIALCPNTQLAPNTYAILVNYFYLAAGILFFIAGLLYIPVLGSKWILPNIFIPYKREQYTSMMWYILWFYFWGGAMFCMAGICLYWYSPLDMSLGFVPYQITTGIGFGGGAFFFFVGAMMLLMRQSRGRCRPSYRQISTNNDMSVHGNGIYRPMEKSAANV